jgi:hypothetical protein
MILLVASGSCSPSPKNTRAYRNRQIYSATASKPVADGLSHATAIVIAETAETTGVHDEYLWIKEHYTDYEVELQSLESYYKKPFDVIRIKFSDGRELNLYFDISRFFGKS